MVTRQSDGVRKKSERLIIVLYKNIGHLVRLIVKEGKFYTNPGSTLEETRKKN